MTGARPASTPDTRWWWEGAATGKLLIQRCAECGRLRHPPVPACPHCRSLRWDTVVACGRGVVHSVTVLHHPQLPGFDYPLVAAVVELEEGTRLVSNVVGAGPGEVRIGTRVQVEFADDLPRFKVVEK